MTVERWPAHPTSPPPPEALAARIRELLAAAGTDASTRSDALVDAARVVLARLLREGCASRQSALDLLAADAMATYAFELAAEEPEQIVERTDRAMVRIAALAADRATGDARSGERDDQA